MAFSCAGGRKRCVRRSIFDMALAPSVQRFLDMLTAGRSPLAAQLNPTGRRSAMRELSRLYGPAEPVGRIDEHDLPGPGASALRVRIYVPAEHEHQSGGAAKCSGGLVYFHGGGLIAGDLETHDSICRALTNASGCRVASVNYRLAPEHPFPAAIEDALTAARWVTDHACALQMDPRRIAIGGDSAGGALAAVACQLLKSSSQVRPALQFLLCPILDFGMKGESWQRYGTGYLLEQDMLEHDLNCYLGDRADRFNPHVSPLRWPDLADSPTSCIHTAEFDPLRTHAEEFADRLRSAGVSVTYRCHAGMIHQFYGLKSVIPYAGEAVKQLGSDIRRLLPA
jgi:acetyl esterase